MAPDQIANTLHLEEVDEPTISSLLSSWFAQGSVNSAQDARRLLRDKELDRLEMYHVETSNLYLRSQLYLPQETQELIKDFIEKIECLIRQQQG